MEKVERQSSQNVSHKSFLVILKFIPYIISFGYLISTIGDIFEYDLIGLGYFIHIGYIPWLFLYLTSFIFKYCSIHRLPLYYILVNDALNLIDYYIGIPIGVVELLELHLVVVILFIYCYAYKYVKLKRLC